MKKLLCLLVLGIVACASTPASDIAAMEATLAAADTAALAYVKLPTCASTLAAGTICKKITVVVKIGQASSAAYIAVKAAESAQTQTAIKQAQTAIAALQAIISSIVNGG